MEVLEHPPHAACAVGPFMLSRCGRGTYIERGQALPFALVWRPGWHRTE